MKLTQSKPLAVIALLIVVIAVIVTVVLRMISAWWEYSTLFCAFMMAFCHLMALNLKKMSVRAADQLDRCALMFAILAVIGVVVLCIVN